MWHARWTVPVHVMLPVIGWGLTQIDPQLSVRAFLAVHLAFLGVLVVTVPWWWRRISELAALLLVNHAATFLSFMILAEVLT